MTSDAKVTVLIAGTEFTDIKSYAIDSDALTLCDTFSLELASPDGAHSDDINGGDPVAIYLEDPAANPHASVITLPRDIHESIVEADFQLHPGVALAELGHCGRDDERHRGVRNR
jgi:hypothetical protein